MNRRVPALLALLLVLSGCGASSKGERSPAAPKALPDVSLRSFTGTGSLDLGDLRGPAVVNLWASWCTPCKRELPYYQAFARKHAGKVKVLGIDFRETQVDRARQLVAQTGVTYPLYSDPEGELRAVGLPKLLLVGADGRLAHQEYVEIKDLSALEKLVHTYLPEAVA